MTGVDHPFAIVPLGLVTDDELPAHAVKVYAVLAERANSAGVCWPGIDHLAGTLHTSDRTIRRCIAALEQAGWIEVTRRNHGMVQQTSVYRINRVSAAVDTPEPIGHHSPMVADTTVQADRTPQSPSHRTPQSPGEPDPIEQDPIDSTKDSSVTQPQSDQSVTQEIAEFDDWWQHVPRRVGKGQARKAYRTARKKATATELLEAADRWATAVANSDLTFTPHPSTWLNGERWLDDEPAPQQATADTATSQPGPRQPAAYTPDPTPADLPGSVDAIRRARQKVTV